jgi:hypothetical protein
LCPRCFVEKFKYKSTCTYAYRYVLNAKRST